MSTPRTLSRAPRLPRVELSRQQERSEFSSCGGVPRSGEVVFFYNITNSQDHPARWAPLHRRGTSLNHFITLSLTHSFIALCALLSLTRTKLRDDHHYTVGPIFHLPIFSRHRAPIHLTRAHQYAPDIYHL